MRRSLRSQRGWREHHLKVHGYDLAAAHRGQGVHRQEGWGLRLRQECRSGLVVGHRREPHQVKGAAVSGRLSPPGLFVSASSPDGEKQKQV